MGKKERSYKRFLFQRDRMRRHHWRIVSSTDPQAGPPEPEYIDPDDAGLHKLLLQELTAVGAGNESTFSISQPGKGLPTEEFDRYTDFFKRATATRWTVSVVILPDGQRGWEFSLT